MVGRRSGSAGAGSVCLSWAPGAAVVRLGLGGGGRGRLARCAELTAMARRLAGSTRRLAPVLGVPSAGDGREFDRSSQQAV